MRPEHCRTLYERSLLLESCRAGPSLRLVNILLLGGLIGAYVILSAASGRKPRVPRSRVRGDGEIAHNHR